ncbi:MAG: hypothetical protein H6R38_561 [Deltaproteobacteria bacterium]|nr:hypothetical protein [Deltaproteobacteria bacterium]
MNLLQLPVGLDLDLFGHQQVADGTGLEMVDQPQRLRFRVPKGFDDGVAVGQFQKGFQVLQLEQLRVIAEDRDAQGTRVSDSVGVLVDVRHAQYLRLLVREDLVRQELQKRLAGPAAADNREVGS